MTAPRIYIDTSVYGGCFEPRFKVWSTRLLHDTELGLFVPVVSELLESEILGAPPPVRAVFSDVAALAERIDESDAADDLAARYAERAILGRRYENDMMHVALASLAEVDALVSWNFKHMLRFDKIRQFNTVNLEFGYRALRIHSPQEVLSHGEGTDD